MASPRQHQQSPEPLLLQGFSRDDVPRATRALAAGAEVTVDLCGKEVPVRLQELLRKPGTGTLVLRKGWVDGIQAMIEIKRKAKLVHMRFMCIPKRPALACLTACEVEAEGCLWERHPKASLPQYAGISMPGVPEHPGTAVVVAYGTFTACSCSWQGLTVAVEVEDQGTITLEACHINAVQAMLPKIACLTVS